MFFNRQRKVESEKRRLKSSIERKGISRYVGSNIPDGKSNNERFKRLKLKSAKTYLRNSKVRRKSIENVTIIFRLTKNLDQKAVIPKKKNAMFIWSL